MIKKIDSVNEKDVLELKKHLGKQLRIVQRCNKTRRKHIFEQTSVKQNYQSEILSGKINYTVDKLLKMCIASGAEINITLKK